MDMAQAKVTTDHGEICKWAEARGGRPAAVHRTHSKDNVGIIRVGIIRVGIIRVGIIRVGIIRVGIIRVGIIRIEFPDAPNAKDDALEEISWEEFFEKFEESNLALLYQQETAKGERSNFNKLAGRETAEAREHGETHASRRHGRS
jgi:hypothetical protein